MFEANTPGAGTVLTEAQALAIGIRAFRQHVQKLTTKRSKTDADWKEIQIGLKALDICEGILARFNAAEAGASVQVLPAPKNGTAAAK